MEQERTAVIVSVWSSSARSIIDSLRQRSFLPYQVILLFLTTFSNSSTLLIKHPVFQLVDTSWQLDLAISSDNASRMKSPHGILQLTVANSDGENENVLVGLDAGQLRDFYSDLERIQSQLDSLK